MRHIFSIAALILFTLSLNTNVSSQTENKAEEINQLVKKLSWESTTLNYNVLISISRRGEAATQLIKIGKSATDALLKSLTDENKALAAHFILTTIWERPIIYVASNAIYKKELFGKKIVAYIRDCNGLKWTTYKSGKQQIKSNDLTENASKWQKKIDNYRLRNSS
jgi:hypothetical protein